MFIYVESAVNSVNCSIHHRVSLNTLFQVFPVLALFFGHMKDSLFWSWLGMKRVLDVFSSLEKFKVITS